MDRGRSAQRVAPCLYPPRHGQAWSHRSRPEPVL